MLVGGYRAPNWGPIAQGPKCLELRRIWVRIAAGCFKAKYHWDLSWLKVKGASLKVEDERQIRFCCCFILNRDCTPSQQNLSRILKKIFEAPSKKFFLVLSSFSQQVFISKNLCSPLSKNLSQSFPPWQIFSLDADQISSVDKCQKLILQIRNVKSWSYKYEQIFWTANIILILLDSPRESDIWGWIHPLQPVFSIVTSWLVLFDFAFTSIIITIIVFFCHHHKVHVANHAGLCDSLFLR